jgi:hypothetical protein
LLSLIIARFIPLYFTNNHLKFGYYVVLLICLATSAVIKFSRWSNRIQVWAKTFVVITSFLFGLLVFLLLALINLISTAFGYADAGTFYTLKNNSEIKIVSRYYDQGAFGGGTEPEDYETILRRPITPFYKLETKVDTTTIDKTKWIKQSYYKTATYPTYTH